MDQDEKTSLLKRLAKALGVSAPDMDVTKTEENDTMADDAVTKKLEAAEAEVSKLRADLAAMAEERQAELAKSEAEAFRATLAKAAQKAFDDMDEDEKKRFMEERTKKSDESEPLAKMLDTVTKANAALEARIAKFESDAVLAQAKADLADLEGFVKVDEFAENYVTLAKSNKDAADAMVAQMRAVAKQAKEGGLFKVLGRDGQADTSADAQISKAVRQYQEAHPGVTEAVATDKVLQAQPELYNAYVRGA